MSRHPYQEWPDVLHWRLTVSLCYAQVLLKDLSKQERKVANQLTRSGYLVTELSEVGQGPFVVAFVSKLHMEYTRFCFYSQSYTGSNAHVYVWLSETSFAAYEFCTDGQLFEHQQEPKQRVVRGILWEWVLQVIWLPCVCCASKSQCLKSCIAMQGLHVTVASWSTPFTRRRTSVWCSRPNELYASAVEVGIRASDWWPGHRGTCKQASSTKAIDVTSRKLMYPVVPLRK